MNQEAEPYYECTNGSAIYGVYVDRGENSITIKFELTKKFTESLDGEYVADIIP